MAVDEPRAIDITSLERNTDRVILTISDHLPWANNPDHVLLLQDKLNHHRAFIESGDIPAAYPAARDRALVIEVVTKYDPDDWGRHFLDKAQQIITDAGIQFRVTIFDTGDPAARTSDNSE